MGKHADSTDSKILRRIQSRKRGWVFTPDSFTDLGTRRETAMSLGKIGDETAVKGLNAALRDSHHPLTFR